MPDKRRATVTNTTPLIALTAATGSLDILRSLYTRVVVPNTRLSKLNITGSIGILLKAKSMGYPLSIPEAINRMRARGIWLSERVVRFALEHRLQP